MKILTVANEKGGVGKTFIATQFAMYCALIFHLRVALIDLDQQGNASKFLELGGKAVKEPLNAADLLLGAEGLSMQHESFVYFAADRRLSMLEKQGDAMHGAFVDSLKQALQKLESCFDLIVIDTNPNPDIRSNAGLMVCTHLLSPVQLNKEPIDGLAALFERIGEYAALNTNLPGGFLGMLFNMFEKSNFQAENANALISQFGGLLIQIHQYKIETIKNSRGKAEVVRDAEGNIIVKEKRLSFGTIANRICIAECQSLGLPLWEMTSCYVTWREVKPIFFTLLENMQIECPNRATAAMNAVLNECRKLYGRDWNKIVRQFWMTNNPLPLISISKQQLLRDMRGCVPLSILKSGENHGFIGA